LLNKNLQVVGWPSLTLRLAFGYNGINEKEIPNMKNFIALIFAALIANSAFATWIAPVETATCTRDYNAWGHAGKCECPHATRYERALGQCVQGAPIDITVDGVIATEVTFVGEDEIKSFVLTAANKDNYELVLSRMLKAEIEEFEAQGLNYRITGEVLETYDASEIVARPKIIVATVEVLATFRDAPEITIAE
jgi:hypothetical protein